MGAIRVGRLYGETGRDTLDDLIQQTYVKVCAHDCRILRQFAGKSANDLRAYLRVVAANVARDHFSARFPDRNAVSLDALVELSQSGVGSQSSVEFDTLIQQIDTLIERIPGQNKTRDRTVFWLYYRAGLTSKAIAAIPAVGMTTKGVESIL